MTTRRRLSAFIAVCMLFSMLLIPVRNVNADTKNEAVLDARRGIVQVMYSAQNADKEMKDIYGGTGFLIGVEESGAQYVITNHHVIDPFQPEYMDDLEEEQKAVWDYLGIPYDQDIKVQIRIVLKRDTYINADVIESSKSTDFAILKLEQPIYGDRKPLPLADSDELTETEDVYALGFPAIVQAMQNSQLYTSSDVTINDGKVSKLADSVLIDQPIPCINHSATITSGNSGGPLVNANGEVVGVNRHTDLTGTYFYSIQINEISEVLDLRGIEYEKADGSGNGVVPEPTITETPDISPEPTVIPVPEDNSELFDELEALIDDASKIDLSKMTEETAANFKETLEDAKSVYDNSDSTKADLEKAIDDLENAKRGLMEKAGGLSSTLIIAIAAIAVVIIIVVVAIIISSSNKKKRIQAEKEKQKLVAASMQSMNPAGGYQQPMGGQPQWNQPKPPFNPMMNDGAEETGILNDGSTETTVLGGQNMPTAYLIRRKNNESITISKPIFKLGKERRKVDYCVADNTNVSRTHADIILRNGEFFIVDNNATNGTTVNGVTVAAGQERRLMNNDTIKLADEEFQFRTF